MTKQFKIITVILASFFIGLAAETFAQERETLSARLRGKIVTFQKESKYRVDDQGRPKKYWYQQVVYRATNDTFVYRSEGKATARHDEVSSPEMIFHTTNGSGVRGGHVFQNRGN